MSECSESDARPLPQFPRSESLRYRMFREFFLAIRRGLDIGGCGSCESVYLMAKLCLQEGADWLTDEERRDVESWVEAGTVLDLDTGCDDACPIIRLYSRMSR